MCIDYLLETGKIPEHEAFLWQVLIVPAIMDAAFYMQALNELFSACGAAIERVSCVLLLLQASQQGKVLTQVKITK